MLKWKAGGGTVLGVVIGLCYTGDGRQLRAVSPVGPRMGERQCPSRGHLVMSGDSFGFHHRRERCATGISWAQTRDAAKYFIMPRTALRMSVVLRLRNPIGGTWNPVAWASGFQS